jgi:hypothetical protein
MSSDVDFVRAAALSFADVVEELVDQQAELQDANMLALLLAIARREARVGFRRPVRIKWSDLIAEAGLTRDVAISTRKRAKELGLLEHIAGDGARMAEYRLSLECSRTDAALVAESDSAATDARTYIDTSSIYVSAYEYTGQEICIFQLPAGAVATVAAGTAVGLELWSAIERDGLSRYAQPTDPRQAKSVWTWGPAHQVTRLAMLLSVARGRKKSEAEQILFAAWRDAKLDYVRAADLERAAQMLGLPIPADARLSEILAATATNQADADWLTSELVQRVGRSCEPDRYAELDQRLLKEHPQCRLEQTDRYALIWQCGTGRMESGTVIDAPAGMLRTAYERNWQHMRGDEAREYAKKIMKRLPAQSDKEPAVSALGDTFSVLRAGLSDQACAAQLAKQKSDLAKYVVRGSPPKN